MKNDKLMDHVKTEVIHYTYEEGTEYYSEHLETA
jgi:hypothetical protein